MPSMKSKANFNPYIDKIDLNFWRELCVKEGKLCHYKKGEYFLHRRETPKYFGFITSGAFKYTIIDTDGNEHITGLALCDTLAGDFYSSIRKESSLVALQAITDSNVWVCSTNLFRQILKENIELRCVMAEELFRQTHDRYLNLYRQSPKERYWELIRRCPNILQDITLKELASYLQITPTYLSRIRKEITFGKE